MRILILIILLMSCEQVEFIGNAHEVRIYNGSRSDFMYIKFGNEDWIHRKSADFGEPLRFAACSHTELIVVGDIKEDPGYLRPMVVMIDNDTLYKGWAVNHRVQIDLVQGKWSHYFGKAPNE